MIRPVPIGLALTALVAGSYLYTKLNAPKAKGKTQYTLAFAKREDVKKTVSATGTLKAWSTVEVKSKAGGRVDVLAVDVGDRVKKGQVVAKIDPTDSLLTYNQAKASTDSAEAQKAQSAETYQLTVSQRAIAVQQARANLDSSKAALRQAAARLQTAQTESNAQPALTNAAIGQAQAGYDSAIQAKAKLVATQAQDRAAAQATYDQAVANDRNSQVNLQRQQALLAKGFVSQSTVDSATASAGVYRATVASAKAKLDTLEAQQKAERDSAQAAVEQAQAGYRSAQASSYQVVTKRNNLEENHGALLQAKAAVETAEAQLNDAIAGQRNGAIKKLDIAASAASVASAQAQFANAKATLDQTTVTAPLVGVVLSKSVEQGTMITSGQSFNSTGSTIVTLGDVSRMYVDVAVDETDIGSIRLGNRVDIEFDAFPDGAFSGKVTKINPEGVVESNVTTIHVRVEVDNSAKGFSELKPEMNATCEFIEGEAQNAISIPSEAVHTEGDESYVDVASGGKPVDAPANMPSFPAGGPPAGGFPGGAPPAGMKPPAGMTAPGGTAPAGSSLTFVDVKVERRKVTLGVAGNESTEIKSGLQEGERVVVSKLEPKTDDEAPKSAFGGGMGPGGRR